MMQFPKNIQSLRIRLVLGTGAMLLPLLVLAAVGYVLFENVITGMDHIRAGVFDDLVPVAYLQSSAQRYRYLIDHRALHQESAPREELTSLATNIDSAFVRLAGKQASLAPGMISDLHDAQHAWRRVKHSAQMLSDGARITEASPALRQVHTNFNQLEQSLQRLHTNTLREINVQMGEAQKARRNVLMLIGAMSTIGLLLAVAAAIILMRTILLPLANLEQAAERFGAGDLHYRIRRTPHNELGKVARTFNAMAETIERHQSSLQHMAVRDALTGLYNRRELKARLGTELERARRYSHPFALLLIDIDHFKAVNDSYGHPAGDRVLIALAAKLHDGMRPVDTVARYGGEEFAVILPEIRAEEALATAERLREHVSAEPFTWDHHGLSMTVSIGVAVFPQHGGRSDILLQRADRALYRAKEQGRDRVTLAEPDEGEPSVPN